MPDGIHAKNQLSLKSDLKITWIDFAHRLIDFSHKAFILCEKAAENVKKLFFWEKSHVRHAGMHSKTDKSVGFMFSYDFTIQNLTEEIDSL